ncbi:hypothetical protein FTO68_11335 [Methanocalculus taiwanensis]|uniref:DUF4352 domain-containing protein n=1 Tax=Methanocalculus taiwanensis TaxID=106207 RepID=A0ABD4TMQ1_9EURY|nr:hypothetical protein [Methanocalculus taiwanensis]MCQ1539567.1 hypothetical protein [Methanocalculus taiwanensis]
MWISNGALILVDPDDPAILDVDFFTADALPKTSDEKELQDEAQVSASLLQPDRSTNVVDRILDEETGITESRSKHKQDISIKEVYLNAIIILIATLFLTAIIFSTAPAIETEDTPVSSSSSIGSAESESPLAFAALSKYFGTTVLVVNTTPELPPDPEPEEIVPAIEYDDERFLDTIKREAIPLTIITMQMVIAIDQSNTNIFNTNNDALHALAQESFNEVEALYVSPNESERKRDYQHAMVQFMKAATYLRRGLPASENERREALNILASATEHLDSALKDIPIKPGEVDERSLYTFQLSQLSQPSKPDDLLQKNTPFIYMDATRSNEISIYPQYGRLLSSFWYETDSGTVYVTAPSGRTYIAVFIKVTHRGNLDGRRYTIQTPSISAFTLHGGGDTFNPIQTSAYTSLGQMYRQQTLNRKEMAQGTLIFEVPQTLQVKDTYLTINLGSVWGSPSWDLE